MNVSGHSASTPLLNRGVKSGIHRRFVLKEANFDRTMGRRPIDTMNLARAAARCELAEDEADGRHGLRSAAVKTLSLSCIPTAFALRVRCLCGQEAAFVLPSSCVSAAFAAIAVPFLVFPLLSWL